MVYYSNLFLLPPEEFLGFQKAKASRWLLPEFLYGFVQSCAALHFAPGGGGGVLASVTRIPYQNSTPPKIPHSLHYY
jgi:hypothetical protein